MNAALTVSLDTVVAMSRMLGHPLEDRSTISRQQDPGLVRQFRIASKTPLANARQREMFLVAPLDILVEDVGGDKRFHIIEINGTGIGGLTNLPADIVQTVLAGLSEFAASIPEHDPLLLVAVSGLESSKHPRRNHLVHEKLLYVDALKRGLEHRGERVTLLTMEQITDDPEALSPKGATVVLGYMKEFLNHLRCRNDGRLTLGERHVSAAVNDRFCMNVVSRFGDQVDLGAFRTLNRCFAAGADKGVAYGLLQEFSRKNPHDRFPSEIEYGRAENRTSLIDGVVRWIRRGRRLVIKPQGAGLGHGLEFFLDPEECVDGIVHKIDHSIRLTEHYYGAIGGAFPYTLCSFIDSCSIAAPEDPRYGHKYELRVVVYRDGSDLKAVPSIVKISSQEHNAERASKLSLINNITTSAEAKQREGKEFMLPLSNLETLQLLEIRPEVMEEVSSYCSAFMRFVLEETSATGRY